MSNDQLNMHHEFRNHKFIIMLTNFVFRAGMGVGVSIMNYDQEIICEGDKNIFDFCKEGSLKKVMELLNGFPKDDEVRIIHRLHINCHFLHP